MEDLMVLDDLKTGMLVEQRDGDLMSVQLDTYYHGDVLKSTFSKEWLAMDVFDDDMTVVGYGDDGKYADLDIVAVYVPHSVICLGSKDRGDYDVVWERDEEEEEGTVNMAMLEMQEALQELIEMIEKQI